MGSSSSVGRRAGGGAEAEEERAREEQQQALHESKARDEVPVAARRGSACASSSRRTEEAGHTRRRSGMLSGYVSDGSHAQQEFKRKLLVFQGMLTELLNAQGSALLPVRETSSTFIRFARQLSKERPSQVGAVYIRTELLQPSRPVHAFSAVAVGVAGGEQDEERCGSRSEREAFVAEGYRLSERVRASGQSQSCCAELGGRRAAVLATPIFTYEVGELHVDYDRFRDSALTSVQFRSGQALTEDEEREQAGKGQEEGLAAAVASARRSTVASSSSDDTASAPLNVLDACKLEGSAGVGAVLVQCFWDREEEVSESAQVEVYELVYEARGMLRQSIESEARQEYLYQSQRGMAAAMDTAHIFHQSERGSDVLKAFATYQEYVRSSLNARDCVLFLKDNVHGELWHMCADGRIVRLGIDDQSLPGRCALEQEVFSLHRTSGSSSQQQQQQQQQQDSLFLHGIGGIEEQQGWSSCEAAESELLKALVGGASPDNMLCMPITSMDTLGVIVVANKSWGRGCGAAAVDDSSSKLKTSGRGKDGSYSTSAKRAAREAMMGEAKASHYRSPMLLARGALDFYSDGDVALLQSTADEMVHVIESRFVELSYLMSTTDADAPDEDLASLLCAYDPSQAHKRAGSENRLKASANGGKNSSGSEAKHGRLGAQGDRLGSTSFFPKAADDSGSATKAAANGSSATGSGLYVTSTGLDKIALNSARASALSVNVLNTMPAEQLELMDRDLVSWDFDVLAQADEHLVTCSMRLFEKFDLIKALKLEPVTLHNFLTEVQSNYLANPYHNWKHAFSVLHASSITVRTCASDLLLFADVFALFVGSVCHDVAHPGTNNDYQVHSESDLALLYNDVSVLENFHAATAFKILKLEHCDIFKGLSKQTRRQVREAVIKSILSTDISQHFTMVAGLKTRYHDAVQKALAAAVAGGAIGAGGAGTVPSALARGRSADRLLGTPAAAAAGAQVSSRGAAGQEVVAPGAAAPPRRMSLAQNNAHASFKRKKTAQLRKSVIVPSLSQVKEAGESELGAAQAGAGEQQQSTVVFDRAERADRLMVIECIIHTADLANPVLDFELYRSWTTLVVQEFYDQSVEEKRLGLPSQPHMQNPPTDIKALGTLQLSFLDYVVAPLWYIMRDVFPGLSGRCAQLESNRAKWKRILSDLESKIVEGDDEDEDEDG